MGEEKQFSPFLRLYMDQDLIPRFALCYIIQRRLILRRLNINKPTQNKPRSIKSNEYGIE